MLPNLELRFRLRSNRSANHPFEFNRNRRRVRVAIWSGYLVVLTFLVIALFSYLTNPFAKFSIVKDEVAVAIQNNELVVVSASSPVVRNNRLARTFSFLKSGYHMIGTLIDGGDKIPGESVDDIIAEIHRQRFAPDLPFLISGDHFSVLYPRSLGIFYHSLLDPRTALSAENWQHRQEIYLKTLTFSLAVYAESDTLSTTIVPIGPQGVVLINIYAPPSDTLYSMLYALSVLKNDSLATTYPFSSPILPELTSTDQAAQTLLENYRATLQRHFQTYWSNAFDPVTGLVRRDLVLSGTKDSVRRHGSFYDNVMLWKTAQLAQELGLTTTDPALLASLKIRILDTFWRPEQNYFTEEIGTNGTHPATYSSDWLIAYQTGLLRPDNPNDLPYLLSSIEYIRTQKLAEPFGLRFSNQTNTSNYYWPVKYGTPDYVTTAIWSHWGMEYTKLLAHVAQITGDETYLFEAEKQISAYSTNITQYAGFPELYDTQGKMYRDRLYRSVRATGWVVNFQEARSMVAATRSSWTPLIDKPAEQ